MPQPLGVGMAGLDGRPEKEALRLRDISVPRLIEEVQEVQESNLRVQLQLEKGRLAVYEAESHLNVRKRLEWIAHDDWLGASLVDGIALTGTR